MCNKVLKREERLKILKATAKRTVDEDLRESLKFSGQIYCRVGSTSDIGCGANSGLCGSVELLWCAVE